MGDPPFKTQNSLLQRNVHVNLQVITLTLYCGMRNLMQLYINVSRVEVEALLGLAFEKDHITCLHPLFELKLQVSWSNDDLFTSTNRASLLRPKTSPSTFSAFHIHFLDGVLDLDLFGYLACSSACSTGLLDSALIASSLAVFADLSSPEAVDLLTSCVKLLEGNPHFSPEVSSFPKGCFFQFLETCFSVKIVCDSFGDVDQRFIRSFDFDIFFLYIWITGVAIRMVLD